MFDLARTIAPASLMRLTWNASLRGDEPVERQRSVRALQTDRLEVVLHDHRDAVQRAREASLRDATIEIVGLLQRLGVGHDDGVDRRAVLVVRLDAPEILLHERPAGDAAGLERILDLRDGRLLHTEGRQRLRLDDRRRKQKQDGKYESVHESDCMTLRTRRSAPLGRSLRRCETRRASNGRRASAVTAAASHALRREAREQTAGPRGGAASRATRAEAAELARASREPGQRGITVNSRRGPSSVTRAKRCSGSRPSTCSESSDGSSISDATRPSSPMSCRPDASISTR